jgi:hypothetical protein
MSQESKFEELLESAYHHTINEFGLENVKPSFQAEFEKLQKAHDAIHEFMLLALLLVPSQARNGIGWQKKSAFLVYHWEAFHLAHRSLSEVLCAYYNAAFILLRVTFELLIKGAFWECLSHKEFRENSQVLDKNQAGNKIKEWFNDIFEQAPDVEHDFEQVSVSVYDKVELIIEAPKYRPSIKTIVRQLDSWDMFNPIAEAETRVYGEIYGRLSADVHVIPDRTDIGRRLVDEAFGVFRQELLSSALDEYTSMLHRIMDLAIVIELNVMKDFIEKHDEVKVNLKERLGVLDQLGLEDSLKRANHLLG